MAGPSFILNNSGVEMSDAGGGSSGPETELSLTDLSISEAEEEDRCVRDEDLSSWAEVKH